jgi:hypothetical protein
LSLPKKLLLPNTADALDAANVVKAAMVKAANFFMLFSKNSKT